MWKRNRAPVRRRRRRVLPAILALATLLIGPALAPAVAASPGQEFGTLMQQGVEALRQGQVEDAAAAFRAALRLQPDDPAARSLLASALLQQGDPQAALDAVRPVVAASPDYYPARDVIARVYLALEDPESAIPHLREAVRLQPEDSASRALLAELLLQGGHLDEAAEQAEELSRRHPEQAVADNLLGIVQLRRERFAEALDAYERALAHEPDNALARYGKAAALVGLERPDEAVPLLARLVDENPENADALVLLAELLAKRGVEERLDAIRFYRSALAQRPASQRIVRGLASLYLDLRLDAQGIALIRDAGDPADPRLLMALGRMLERESQYEEARDAYRRALEAGAGAEAHYRLGIVLANLADLPGAEAEFRATLELDRRHPAASRELGSVLLDRGKAQEAREALDRAIARGPKDGQAWYLGGIAYLRTGDVATAVDYLREAVDLNPDNPEALYSLGTALSQQGETEESREVLARAQELRRQEQGTDATEVRARRAETIVRDGYVRYRIGDYDQARERFEQVLQLAPDEERAWYYLGLTRAALENEEGAIEALERAARLNPERTGTWVALAELYERAGRDDDARQARERAEELARKRQTR